MNIGTIIIFIFYILLLVLLIYPKSKNYLRANKELATGILYTYLVVWFSRLLLARKTIEVLITNMKTNGLYLFLLLFYVAVPAFFVYEAIQSYIAYYVKLKTKKEEKVVVKEVKTEVKKETKNTKKKGKKK